jgi:hypothetical protein
MIGLYVTIIDREAGVRFVNNNFVPFPDGTKRLIPSAYSIFIGRVFQHLKPDNPVNVKSEPNRIRPGDKPNVIIENLKNCIEKEYCNVGVRADIGHESYLSAIFNPFTDKASTYFILNRTFYNDKGNDIADVSVKAAATYFIKGQVWSAKVNAEVKVLFGI